MLIPFTQRLHQPHMVILDGATGTQLQKMGLPLGQAPELWNLTHPDALKTHHEHYLESGAEVILTNTFGGNRPRLELADLGAQLIKINRTAVDLARAVASDKAWVFGNVGPLGLSMQDLTVNEAVTYFAEQIQALVEGGVDGLFIETMHDLREAQAAVTAAHHVTSLPICVTLSFDTAGRTFRGVTPTEAIQTLWPLGLTAIGVNCGNSLEENLAAIVAMRIAEPQAILLAKPNAGLPQLDEARTHAKYHLTPAMMAEYALLFAAQGVKLLGGCCGTTPAHIAAMRAVLTNH